MSPTVWFPDEELEHDGSRKGKYYEEAKRICHTCPHEKECLEYALENRERWGVWGGKDPRQRYLIRRGRRQEQQQEAV